MPTTNENNDAPSIENASTHIQPSNDSTTTVSAYGNQDPEKGLGPEKDEVHPPAEKSFAAGPAPATPAIGPPPDGGLQAWLVVLGAFCGLFVSFGWINCKFCSAHMRMSIELIICIIQALECSKHTMRVTSCASSPPAQSHGSPR